MAFPLISIVVPILDEARALPSLLDDLGALDGEWEIIVVDGGSADASRRIAAAHPAAATLLAARRGRAWQLNAGARAAHGDALVFLHADTRLPPDAYASIVAALQDPGLIGGNFALRFDGDDRFSRLLGRWYALQRRAGIYYGDSAMWLRLRTFEQLGGFAALAIMEDYDLARRMERAGPTVCLPGPAVTSARRWRAAGLTRTIASWVLIRWLFIAGAPPHRLARLYPAVR